MLTWHFCTTLVGLLGLFCFWSRPWKNRSLFSTHPLTGATTILSERYSIAISLACYCRALDRCLGVFCHFQTSVIISGSWNYKSSACSHALSLALISRLERQAVYQPLIWHERNRSVLSLRLDSTKCQSNQCWWKLIALMSTEPCNFISSLHMPSCGFTPITTCIN